jgi:hypothetical protein
MTTRCAAFTVLALWAAMTCCPALDLLGQPRGPLDQGEILALVGQAPDEEDFPEAEALILFDGTYVKCENGLAAVRRQRLIRVFTENAIDELGDPRISFDRSRQELEIHASRTYLLDGSTMDTPENGCNEVTPFGLDLAREYLDIREMVVTHVGIERGVAILLDWTVRDTKPAIPRFSRLIFLHDEFPVLEKEVVAEGDLWGETVNPTDGTFRLPEPARSGDMMVWHVGDLGPRPTYADERLGDQLPWIALAAVPVWEAMLAEVGRGVTLAAATRQQLDGVLDDMEREEPFTSDREVLERISEAIGERTELIRYQPWVFGSSPKGADAAYLQSAATPLDRCVMAIAACSTKGFDASLVLPAEWGSLTKAVPVMEVFGDPFVRAVGPDGRVWFVDPVGGAVSARAPLPSGRPYFMVSGERVERAAAPVDTSEIRLAVFWDLTKGEAKADGSITGPVVETLAWKEPEGLVKTWLEAWTDSAEAREITVLESGPQGISYAVSLDAPLPDPDKRDRVLLDLPMPLCDLEDLLPHGLSLVRSEIDGVLFAPAAALVDLAWKVRLPEGFVLLPLEDRSASLAGGSLTIRRREAGRLLEVDYRFEWDGRGIHPQVYTGYRQMALDALDRRLTRLVLAKE